MNYEVVLRIIGGFILLMTLVYSSPPQLRSSNHHYNPSIMPLQFKYPLANLQMPNILPTAPSVTAASPYSPVLPSTSAPTTPVSTFLVHGYPVPLNRQIQHRRRRHMIHISLEWAIRNSN